MLTIYIKLEPVGNHKMGKTETSPPTLAKLVNIGVQDPQISNDVFMALLKELSTPGRYVNLGFFFSPFHTDTDDLPKKSPHH